MRTKFSADRPALVGRISWLECAPDIEIKRLLAAGQVADVKAGRVLVTESAAGREAFLALLGTARVTMDGFVLGRVHPGGFIGHAALLDHGPHATTVTAETQMRVLAFDSAGFAEALAVRRVAREVERDLARQLRLALVCGAHPAPSREGDPAGSPSLWSMVSPTQRGCYEACASPAAPAPAAR